ncbi:leishmanolysin-like peptidase [Tanacetum coccineum]
MACLTDVIGERSVEFKTPEANSTLNMEGVADVDSVLLVTARPTTGNTLAWTVACERDQWGRAITADDHIIAETSTRSVNPPEQTVQNTKRKRDTASGSSAIVIYTPDEHYIQKINNAVTNVLRVKTITLSVLASTMWKMTMFKVCVFISVHVMLSGSNYAYRLLYVIELFYLLLMRIANSPTATYKPCNWK